MLKGIREKAIENPQFFKFIMGAVAATFIFSLGWWGGGGGSAEFVAKVNGKAITKAEYQRAYKNTYNFYKDIFKDKFDEQMIKQLDLRNSVLENLINRKIWLIAAKDMGVAISRQELKNSITSNETFFEDGKFSPILYKSLLAANRLKPRDFENNVKMDMSIQKAQEIVKASAQLTDSEIKEELTTRESVTDEEKESIIRSLLVRKQEAVATSFIEAMKQKVSIERSDTI